MESRTVVVGLGIAGAAITHELAFRGMRVTALDRGDGIQSTLSNQRWLHSGAVSTDMEAPGLLLYESVFYVP